MASSTTSPVAEFVGGVRHTLERIGDKLEPVLAPIRIVFGFIFSSFFRVMILLGIVLLLLGLFVVEGTEAGHLGIYGVSAILIGVVGRIIVHWQLKDS